MSQAVALVILQLIESGEIDQDTIIRGGGAEGGIVPSGPDGEIALLLCDDGESRLQVRCGLRNEDAGRFFPNGMRPAYGVVRVSLVLGAGRVR